MEIFTLLETLEDILEKSRNMPFSSKCIVDKEEVLDIIKEIKKLNENIEDVQVNIRKLAVPINGIFDSVEIQIKD